jgi:IS30 family transposase
MSAEDIAQELDESRDTVRRTLNRNKNNFQKLGNEWGISYRQE